MKLPCITFVHDSGLALGQLYVISTYFDPIGLSHLTLVYIYILLICECISCEVDSFFHRPTSIGVVS